MKTIIVATDYSRASCNALAYAAALARQWQAKIVLFNSFQLPAPAANALFLAERKGRFLAENRERLKAIAEQTACLYNIQVGWSTNFSYITEELDVLVELLDADLVVMGMRGSSEDRKIFGNSTTTIIRHAKYPVLVVPEEASFTGIEKILFACDYKSLAANNRLKLMHELAIAFDARVQVLHVEKAEEELVPVGAVSMDNEGSRYNTMLGSVNLDPLLSNVKHEYKYLGEDNIIRGIDRGVEEFKADLLVMVPHKCSFWDALLERSNTCKMAVNTHVPLLALPNVKK
ncbi:universal stress protein [Cesiribacter sp. SM1]|uniref:universal stress protein n=1 Tax=Cesiribacter sp. SM1 TaxID=2861196 RepID=UPI001CD455B7|nr:universal stress protein [Cesiribacter sp. SM1]